MLHLHGGDVWKYAKQLNDQTTKLLDFSANINPLGPPQGVKEEVLRAVEEVSYYPEPQARTLRKELAAAYGVDPREVIVGNGAAELIFLYCRARNGLQAVMPAPTFSEYALACRAAAGAVHTFPLPEQESFHLSGEKILQRYSLLQQQWKKKQQATVFICHPNNPTGTMLPHAELQKLVHGLNGAGAGVFLDLSFQGFIPGQCLENGALPAVPLDYFQEIIAAPAELFLLFSFTKMFALPGVRLGFGIGPRQLIAAMEQKRDPWSVNVMAQRAGIKCLQEDEYVKKSVALLTAARQQLSDGLKQIGGIKVFPGTANFLLCHLRERKIKASTLAAALAREGIMVRNAANFPGLDPSYIRLAVRLPAENAFLLETLKQVLRDL